MTEKITLEIKSDELRKILLDYYQEFYNDKTIDIVFIPKKEYETEFEFGYLTTKIILKKSKSIDLKIGKCTSIIEQKLFSNDIKKVLTATLAKTDYKVTNIDFKTSEKKVSYEDEENYSFDGISVSLKRKQKVKQKTL